MATPKHTDTTTTTADELATALDAEVVTAEVVGDLEPFEGVTGTDLEEYIATLGTLVVDDPEAIALKIAQRRLAATSVDELLAPQEVRSARDYAYRPLEVREVHFNKSRYDGGVQVYAVFDAVDQGTGELATYACGAADVLVQLYKLVQWGALPITVQLVPAKNPTQNGYFPLHLEAVTPDGPNF